jgi:PLD-like domain/Fibronectin type III domain
VPALPGSAAVLERGESSLSAVCGLGTPLAIARRALTGNTAELAERPLDEVKGPFVTYMSVTRLRRAFASAFVSLAVVFAFAPVAQAQERLCDTAYEDCRATILDMLRAETVGIDVSIWFMDDARYSAEIIRRWQAGVPVRIVLDLRADGNYPNNATIRQSLINAGIPIRHKTTAGINHWKMILYAGQNRMHFSAANFSDGSYSPIVPYSRYVDEAIYFTDDPSLVQSFMTKYDSVWTDTTNYANLANISGPLARTYPTFPISPDLNFTPDQHFMNRVVAQLKLETTQVDAVMFRITSAIIPDELIRRRQAGVNVRLITDRNQYRNPTYFWHSYNVDRMFMAGIPVKWKDNSSGQDMHQKSLVLHSRDLAIFGSSNWTSSSSTTQREHNYFTTKTWFVDWFTDQFARKWGNIKAAIHGGEPITPPMFLDFTPLAPDAPINVAPADHALGQGASVTLRWEGGWWAHKYDIYLGTSPTNLPLVVQDFAPGSATAGVQSNRESYTVGNLAPGTTYYWRIGGKTMANRGNPGPIWSFTTSGGAPPPPTPTNLQASAESPTQVNLKWNDVAGEEGFKIERKPSSSSTWAQIAQIPADMTWLADTNSGLTPATTYNYRVRAFTTGGNSGYSNTSTVTTPSAALSPNDIVLYATDASLIVGNWNVTTDATAAGGRRLFNPDQSGGTITTPMATPVRYFELTFNAQAGLGYRLWMRGKAYNNSGFSDSVYAQFSGSVTSGGAPTFRIGTTSGTMVNLEDCNGCGVNLWGWQDNGFGVNVLGPLVYFAANGAQTIRVQVREDGFSIDQIVLSPDTYLNSAPGALKSDNVILPKQGGSGSPPPSAGARITADAYVRAGASAATNFGAESELVVKAGTDLQYVRQSYLKLNISEVQAGDSVTLRLFGRLSDTRTPTVTARIHLVSDLSWTETGMTWNNKPAADATAQGSVAVSGTTGTWYDVNLTSFVQAQRSAGRTTIAIALISPGETLPYATFGSRESANGPQLVITP